MTVADNPMSGECPKDGILSPERWGILNRHLNADAQNRDKIVRQFCEIYGLQWHRVQGELMTYRHPPPPMVQ